MNRYDLIIIGGGPSGLFCALNSGGEGRRVILLEKNDSFGKKLLLTGSGQCNITHDGDIKEFFLHYGPGKDFVRPCLFNFSNTDLSLFFNNNGLPLTTRNDGKIFPKSLKASDILLSLVKGCVNKSVELRTDEQVTEISYKDDLFIVKTPHNTYIGRTCVLATGGLSYPKTGSTGDGYRFAKLHGHNVTKLMPALTGVVCRNYQFADLTGISFKNAVISIYHEGKKEKEGEGDLLFTHYGLSGPGILDLSRYIRENDILKVSFIPAKIKKNINEDIKSRILLNGTRLISSILKSYSLPERFIQKICEISDIGKEVKCSNLTKIQRKKLLGNLIESSFEISQLRGFNEAMITNGGIERDEIDKNTMESKYVSGLYFIGEVIDVDGDSGGYNLQYAFSSAKLAADSILKKLSLNP